MKTSKNKLIYFSVYLLVIFVIFLKGPRVSTDFELRYFPMAKDLLSISNGDLTGIFKYSTFDLLHINYSILTLIAYLISKNNFLMLIISFQAILTILMMNEIRKYLSDNSKFIIFSVLYLLIFELNQWDYWLTPDSIFRSLLVIIYIKFFFLKENNSFTMTLGLLIMLSLLRMEAILYFIPILLQQYYIKIRTYRKSVLFLCTLVLIPVCYGVFQMMQDTYNLGLISGGSENPREYINYLIKEKFNSHTSYVLTIHSMRFISVILPLSPSWSFIHLFYNLGLYLVLGFLFLKYYNHQFNKSYIYGLGFIYFSVCMVQIAFVVDPTLRYMYTIYTLIIIYILKHSKFNYEKN